MSPQELKLELAKFTDNAKRHMFVIEHNCKNLLIEVEELRLEIWDEMVDEMPNLKDTSPEVTEKLIKMLNA